MQLATPNYQYEKRQRDLLKKKKQEEKRQKKTHRQEDKGVTDPSNVDGADDVSGSSSPAVKQD